MFICNEDVSVFWDDMLFDFVEVYKAWIEIALYTLNEWNSRMTQYEFIKVVVGLLGKYVVMGMLFLGYIVEVVMFVKSGKNYYEVVKEMIEKMMLDVVGFYVAFNYLSYV